MSAFSLIELLVVLGIMSIIGVVSIANFGSFGESQKLGNAASDIQSLLKLSQTNAGSRVVCGGNFGASWWVDFSSSSQVLNLKCAVPATPVQTVKTHSLAESLGVDSVSADSFCSFTYPITIKFSPLYSHVSFSDASGASCVTNAKFLTIIIKNSKNSEQKSIKVDKGGAVSVF